MIMADKEIIEEIIDTDYFEEIKDKAHLHDLYQEITGINIYDFVKSSLLQDSSKGAT